MYKENGKGLPCDSVKITSSQFKTSWKFIWNRKKWKKAVTWILNLIRFFSKIEAFGCSVVPLHVRRMECYGAFIVFIRCFPSAKFGARSLSFKATLVTEHLQSLRTSYWLKAACK